MSANVVIIALSVVSTIAGVAGVVLAVYYGYLRPRWMHSLNWSDAIGVAQRLLAKIERGGWKPDIVIGLGRSGGLWGGYLAGNLGTLPFGVVDLKYDDEPPERTVSFPAGEEVLTALLANHSQGKRVLVVEGASSTGQTFREFRKAFGERFDQSQMRFAVLYKNSVSEAAIDYVGEENLEPWPEEFPWHERSAYITFIGPLRHLIGARSKSPT